MRIIAGIRKGHRISAPRGESTRPTGDRVREAAFNLIGPVDDAVVLDLFAGSGAMGIEALSRGAETAVFVESDSAACRAIDRNLEKLRLTGARVVCRDVLRKTGPLTIEEVSEIRRHPRAGAELLLPIRGAARALPYVLFHHERWDGGGYPVGLRGAAIPLEARLLAVADAFDAMTSPRPYRPPLTAECALREVAACAGAQFDPHVVEAFLDVWS